MQKYSRTGGFQYDLMMILDSGLVLGPPVGAAVAMLPWQYNVRPCEKKRQQARGVVILRILSCSLGRYEMHTSVRPAAVVGGACSALDAFQKKSVCHSLC